MLLLPLLPNIFRGLLVGSKSFRFFITLPDRVLSGFKRRDLRGIEVATGVPLNPRWCILHRRAGVVSPADPVGLAGVVVGVVGPAGVVGLLV